jgi:hypothetical protein
VRDLRQHERLQLIEGAIHMATNHNRHDGHLEGPVRDRSQFPTPSGHWAKRDADTGQIMNVKHDLERFKGVRREKQ